jgi:LytS/YehU family sensor histidine kinase
MPWMFLGPIIMDYPAAIKNTVTALVGGVGAAIAITISIVLTNLVPGVHNEWADHMGSVILGEAAAGAVIALIIGAYRRLQIAVIRAEAKVHEREMREVQLAEAAAKAQSSALQSQINPHFFFNTLNTLSALIPAEATCAQEIVGRLADMFRYTLACSRAEAVTLDQELKFTENYLRLEQARFRERLRVTLPLAEFGDVLLPGLSLQPLVENAIKYGVAPRVEGGAVEVAVHRNGVGCRVDVLSPKDGKVDTDQFFRPGHALENVRDRLKLFAGARSGVDVSNDSLRVCVSLVLAK